MFSTEGSVPFAECETGGVGLGLMEDVVTVPLHTTLMRIPKKFASTPSQLRWLHQPPHTGAGLKLDKNRQIGPTCITDDQLHKAWILANAYSVKSDPKIWAPTLKTFGQRFRWGLYTRLVKWGLI